MHALPGLTSLCDYNMVIEAVKSFTLQVFAACVTASMMEDTRGLSLQSMFSLHYYITPWFILSKKLHHSNTYST